MTGEAAVKSMTAIVATETATGNAPSDARGTEGRVAIAHEIGSEMPIGRGMMTATGNVAEMTVTTAIAGPPREMTGEIGEKTEDMIRETGIAGDLYPRKIKLQCRCV